MGTAGDKILVVGTGFSSGLIKVYFWNGAAGTVTVRSDSTLEVPVPAAAANGPLGVQREPGTIQYTAANFLRIGSGPYISNFSPVYGPTNEMVVINGVHFSGLLADGVKFNGIRAADASVNGDGTMISVHVPYHATSGLYLRDDAAWDQQQSGSIYSCRAGAFHQRV